MYYNLYYNNEIINKSPVGDDIVEKLNTKNYVFKVTKDKYGIEHKERIPTKDIKRIKAYIF